MVKSSKEKVKKKSKYFSERIAVSDKQGRSLALGKRKALQDMKNSVVQIDLKEANTASSSYIDHSITLSKGRKYQPSNSQPKTIKSKAEDETSRPSRRRTARYKKKYFKEIFPSSSDVSDESINKYDSDDSEVRDDSVQKKKNDRGGRGKVTNTKSKSMTKTRSKPTNKTKKTRKIKLERPLDDEFASCDWRNRSVMDY